MIDLCERSGQARPGTLVLRATKPLANAVDRLIHREASTRVCLVLGNSPVEFRLLSVAQRENFRRRVGLLGDAIPDIADEL